MDFNFLRKRDKTASASKHIFSDMNFGTSRLLSLRPKEPFIRINTQEIKDFLKEHRHSLSIIGGALVVFIAIVIPFGSGKASVAHFFPSTCLGNWRDPMQAQGAPSLKEGASIESFSENNSAFASSANMDLFCSLFEGDIPKSVLPQKAVVRIAWSLDDGSIKHDKIEPFSLDDLNEDALGDDSDSSIENDTSEQVTEESATEDSSTDTTSDVRNTDENNASEDIRETPKEETNTPSPTNASDDPTPTDTQESEVAPKESVMRFLMPHTVHAQSDESKDDVSIESKTQPEEVVPEELQTSSTDENEGADEVQEESSIDEEPQISTDLPEDETSVDQDVTSVDTEGQTPLVSVAYTLDGSEWNTLGVVTWENWDTVQFEIPIEVIDEWDDLSTFQVRLRTESTIDASPHIYVDAIMLEVEYTENPSVPLAPDFDEEKIERIISNEQYTLIQTQNMVQDTQEILEDTSFDDSASAPSLRERLWVRVTPPAVKEPLLVIDAGIVVAPGEEIIDESAISEIDVGDTTIKIKDQPDTDEKQDIKNEERVPVEKDDTIVTTDINESVEDVPGITVVEDRAYEEAKKNISESWILVAQEDMMAPHSPIAIRNAFVFWIGPQGTSVMGFDIETQTYFSKTIDPDNMSDNWIMFGGNNEAASFRNGSFVFKNTGTGTVLTIEDNQKVSRDFLAKFAPEILFEQLARPLEMVQTPVDEVEPEVNTIDTIIDALSDIPITLPDLSSDENSTDVPNEESIEDENQQPHADDAPPSEETGDLSNDTNELGDTNVTETDTQQEQESIEQEITPSEAESSASPVSE